MYKILSVVLIACLLVIQSCGNASAKKDLIDSLKQNVQDEKWDPAVPDTAAMRKKYTVVLLSTSEGDMEICLFDATPKHRDNFIKLVESGYYKNLLFHRVIKDFMIQTGDPDSRNAKPGQDLGAGGPGYNVEAEIQDTFYHLRGALCAARQGDEVNPRKMSSGSQFYIVSGSKHGTKAIKDAMNDRSIMAFLRDENNLSYQLRLQKYQRTQDQPAMQVLIEELKQAVKPITDSLYNNIPAKTRQLYATWGGFPALDKEYTIFGFLIKGYDVLEKIQSAETKPNERPSRDIRILDARILKKGTN